MYIKQLVFYQRRKRKDYYNFNSFLERCIKDNVLVHIFTFHYISSSHLSPHKLESKKTETNF